LTRNGFPEQRVQEIETAAEEVLVNVIRDAYPEGSSGKWNSGAALRPRMNSCWNSRTAACPSIRLHFLHLM